MNAEIINRGLTRLLGGNRMLALKAHSPEILVGVGVVGMIGTTVLACRSTLKCREISEKRDADLEKAGEVLVNRPELYSQEDYKRDVTLIYVKYVADVAKNYAPAIILGAASVSCILGGHRILSKRNAAVVAAYKLLDEGFNKYRQRVVEEFGSEKDYAYKNNLREEEVEVEETGENGKPRRVKKQVLVENDPYKPSIYAKFFDECSSQWSTNPEYNLMFLKAQQNYANDLLRARGHLFLNEVYDSLGMERTQAGAVVGWKLGTGDDYVDFGIFDGDNPVKRDFVNGRERSILLDFNVGGVIYDQI